MVEAKIRGDTGQMTRDTGWSNEKGSRFTSEASLRGGFARRSLANSEIVSNQSVNVNSI